MARNVKQKRAEKLTQEKKPASPPAPDPKPKTPVNGVKKEFSTRNVPDVLYAEDGKTYYPCKYCCRAFANRNDLDKHTTVCVGGRSTPSPFVKQKTSNKENLQSEVHISVDDVNNNAERTPSKKSPITRSQLRKSPAEDGKEEKGKRKLEQKPAKIKKIRLDNSEGDTNVITTRCVAENINTISEETRAIVLENINMILKNSSISIIPPSPFNPIIVQTAANETQPALQLTSRNLDGNCVEITTVKTEGAKDPGEKLPDIAEILEKNFGISKPPTKPDEAIESDHDEAKSVKSSPRGAKSVNLESIGESELGEMMMDDPDLDDTIVLEDLDIHICKQCGCVYHSLEDLVNHDKYEHRNLRKRYPPSELEKFNFIFKAANNKTCPICFKVLRSKTAWPRHLQTHSKVLNYECSICKKKFTRNDHRKMHEKRHVVFVKDEGTEDV